MAERPVSPERAAARVWAFRERTELEAAALFDGLAADLDASGAPNALVRLAARCGDDERDHRVRCRAVVDALDPTADAGAPALRRALGSPSLSVRDRALYASVAVGCVTESMSTALLLEMRAHVEHPEAAAAVAAIARDEPRHSQLGWAHLAHAASRGSVAWLRPHVDAMVHAARGAEASASELDLQRYGILSASRSEAICADALERIILPGLRHHGVL